MTLAAIRDMRLARKKPALVSVVTGRVPKNLRDLLTIELPPGSQPGLMDWRPLVGVWVAFYRTGQDWTAMDAAIVAADAAGAKLLGFATDGKAYSLANFANAEAEQKMMRLMTRELEALCTP